MANDRLYLRCRKCGGQALLAKYWGAGDFSTPQSILPDMDEWLGEHTKDCHEVYGMMLDGRLAAAFEMVDESMLER